MRAHISLRKIKRSAYYTVHARVAPAVILFPTFFPYAIYRRIIYVLKYRRTPTRASFYVFEYTLPRQTVISLFTMYT